jgi:gliding motility-associated lipoprotein GldH
MLKLFDKMRRFSSGLLLMVLVTTISCNHVYKSYDKESFSSFAWDDGQIVSFSPEIDDIGKTYSISMGFRHHYGLQTSKFRVRMKIVSPSGKEQSKDYDVLLKDTVGKNIGSCAGDLCDLDMIVFSEVKFTERGVHRVSISHQEAGYQIPGVMEVGIIIDVVK